MAGQDHHALHPATHAEARGQIISPERDRVIVLLSAKAGLRACEIARLDWSMDARGHIGNSIAVHDAIAKKRAGRRIPVHPDLRVALIAYTSEVEPVESASKQSLSSAGEITSSR